MTKSIKLIELLGLFLVFILGTCYTSNATSPFQEALESDTTSINNSSNTGNNFETSGKKRIAVFFVESHIFNYITGLPEEAHLHDFMMESFYTVFDISLGYGQYDFYIAIAGKYLTRENVFHIFDVLVKETQPGDDIFIYWNGHGGTGLPSAGNEADAYDEYLVTFDMDPYDSVKEIRKKVITDDDMGELFNKLKGRNVMALFEACYSGGLMEGESSQGRNLGVCTPPIITASTCKELAAMNQFKNATPSYKKDAKIVDAMRYNASRLMSGNSVSRTSSGSSLSSASDKDIIDQLMNLEGKSVSAPSKSSNSSHFLQAMTQKAKDISRQLEIDVIFSSSEFEPSRAGVFLKRENGEYFQTLINPLAYSYCLTMLFKGEKKEKLYFDEVIPVFEDVLSEYLSIVNEDLPEEKKKTQTPQYIQNLKEAYLIP